MAIQEILQQYYGNYLLKVRNNQPSTVDKYYRSLRVISEFLKVNGKVENNIYEIKELEKLLQIRDYLYSNNEFLSENEHRHRDRSAALNNYINFAQGEGLAGLTGNPSILDIPIAVIPSTAVIRQAYQRSTIIRRHAFELANYKCEFDNRHETFLTQRTLHPYMEGHHVIPMHKQSMFDTSLDVYANVVCLCPLCHRKVHYGLNRDKKEVLDRFYINRRERLIKSGLNLNRDEFINLALR